MDVELLEDETEWSPYLSVRDASKLDDVRDALRRGDIAAAKLACETGTDLFLVGTKLTYQQKINLSRFFQSSRNHSRVEFQAIPVVMHKTGFPPIADAQATTLILGSMPGEQSLRENQYYANTHNAFWRIMASLFGFAHDTPYAERARILLQHRIALWDVIQGCKRRGSLDSAIDNQSIVANDFASFYRKHPHIRRVFFNGTKAEQEYRKRVLPDLPDTAQDIAYSRLPSTSPAMAQLSFEQKLEAWSQALRGS